MFLKMGSNCRKCDLWMCGLAYLVHGRTVCELNTMLLLRPGVKAVAATQSMEQIGTVYLCR